MSLLGGIFTLIALNAGIIIGILLPDILRLWRDRLREQSRDDEDCGV